MFLIRSHKNNWTDWVDFCLGIANNIWLKLLKHKSILTVRYFTPFSDCLYYSDVTTQLPVRCYLVNPV